MNETFEAIDRRLRNHEQSFEDMFGARCWEEIVHSRDHAINAGVEIPEWCLFPIAAAFSVISQYDKEPSQTAAILTGIATWRTCRGVYLFDPTIASMIENADGLDLVPASMLKRLREWAVWVDCPDDRGTIGAFAWLEWDVHTSACELRILRDCDVDGTPRLVNVIVHLDSPTITDGIRDARKQSFRNAGIAGVDERSEADLYADLIRTQLGVDIDPDVLRTQFALEDEWIMRVVARITYLCADKPDIAAGVGFPQDKQPMRSQEKAWRRTRRVKPAVLWEVGWRVARDVQRSSVQYDNETGTRTVRPHIRGAHWHIYRTGKGRTERSLRFLMPTPVGTQTDMPTVIRPQHPQT